MKFINIFKKNINLISSNKSDKSDIIQTFNINNNNNILIVDDNKINRYILNRYLKNINQNLLINEAINGYEAIEMCSKIDYRYVFMDIKMPEIDGIETTKIILQNKPYIHIYGITGQIEKLSIDKAIQAGMKKCIAKPLDKKDLEKLFN